MPINLVTGQPRNGKTLWTLWHVRKRAESEKRTVYYNIGDGPGGKPNLVTIPGWVHLEKPEEWPTTPDNSIIVIDEAQRPFRPRHTTTKVPEHVSLLETHGHRGLDLYFITQHPGLIEGNVLRLVQTHRHVKRLWGSQAATVHEWEDVNKNPDQSRSNSISTTWRYPKDVYSVYESASVHTVKVRPPARLFLLILFALLAPALIGYAIFRPRGASATKADPSTIPASVPAAGRGQQAGMSPREYLEAHQPRVAGLAYSAPIYDQITAPQAAPFPVGCVESTKECRCYTEQGTRLEVPLSLCKGIVEAGYFQFWRAPGGQHDNLSEKRERQPTSPLQANPASPRGAGA